MRSVAGLLALVIAWLAVGCNAPTGDADSITVIDQTAGKWRFRGGRQGNIHILLAPHGVSFGGWRQISGDRDEG